MSRTRSRNTVVELPASLSRTGRYESTTFLGWAYVEGLPFKHEDLTYPFTVTSYAGKVGEISSFTDEVSSPLQYNPCSHTVEVWSAPLKTVSSKHVSTAFGRELEITSIGEMSCGPANLSYAIDRATFTSSAAEDLAYAKQGMDWNVAMSGFNAPVFLGELRDFRDLFSNLGRWFDPKTDWSALQRSIQRSAGTAGKRPVTEVLRTLASANLFRNFVVEPFLNDVRQLMKVQVHVHKQLDRLRSTKPVRIRSSKFSRAVEDTFDGTDPVTYPTHGFRTTSTASRLTTTWALVQYHWDSSVRKPSYTDVLLDSIGVNRPLEVAWELTPWSFLVDYFVSVGDFLSQFNGSFVKVPYTVVDSGYSVKTEKSAKCTLYLDSGQYNDGWSNYSSSTISGELYKKTYTRVRDPLTEGIALPQLRLPSLKQVGNIASIVTLFATASR